ncbi:M20 metallopeptidase family protein [Leekyejoonella antrihumi]|uniref:Amidohydrolase n=1 Tax=Leekyejoonella antrihumi TaxID=1660198 RepID=A0A563E2J8_9MICO|nr:amidohydrolase [Leekyejoonella antrihumi]TWP36770.1 amidohydrolase [Leekyejoonella antrihumi]
MSVDLRRLRAALAEELPAATRLRHAIHADPHISGQENPTAELVADAIGVGDWVTVADTGRLTRLGEGPCVVLRAELDALPLTEQTGVAWAATGIAMHACGHDVHLAAVTAVARAIHAVSGPTANVAVLLQPREERAPSGAQDVVASGILHRIGTRAVVAAHVQPQVAAGTITVTPGVVNASTDEFQVTITGSGGHVGYPHTVHDPIAALCQTALNLQALVPRSVDPIHGAVCMIGCIHAGTANNVIPDRASAAGSLRLMRPDDREPTLERMRQIVQHTATAHECTGQLTVTEGEPVLANDPTLASATTSWLTTMGHTTTDNFRSFGADDFSYYGHQHPALMMFVGTGGDHGLHDTRFLPDDRTIATVAEALLAGYLAATNPVGAQ